MCVPYCVPWWMLQIVVQRPGSIESVCYTLQLFSVRASRQWQSPKNVLPAEPSKCGHISVVEPKEATRHSKWQSKCLLLKNYLGDANVRIGSAFWELLGTHFDCHNVCKFEIYRAQTRFDTWKANRCPLCSRIHIIFETVPGVCTVNGLKGSRGSWTIIKNRDVKCRPEVKHLEGFFLSTDFASEAARVWVKRFLQADSILLHLCLIHAHQSSDLRASYFRRLHVESS